MYQNHHMHTTPIYIKGLAQISIQRPLCDDWIQNGVAHNEAYVRADDPNFRDFLAPLEARRMGRLLKRATVVAETALKEGATTCPDAIFSGTGLGCVESTEKFLETLCREGEHLLSPAHFMQSTHNTISSLIAIRTHCHGANTTFSHKTFSFEQALHEAIMSLRLAECCNALVGGYDEVTPSYYTLLRRAGYVGHPQQVACSETAMAALISTEREGAVARLDAFQTGQATQEGESATRLKDFLDNCGISPDDIDAVVTGHNGVANNDARYATLCMTCLPGIPQLPYKQLFGENYTVSALAFYAAARMLQHGTWPTCLSGLPATRPPQRLLIVNLSADGGYAFTVLSK